MTGKKCQWNFTKKALRFPLAHTLFSFYKNHFYKNVGLRLTPKFKKMYGLSLEHPQDQPNCTCSY